MNAVADMKPQWLLRGGAVADGSARCEELRAQSAVAELKPQWRVQGRVVADGGARCGDGVPRRGAARSFEAFLSARAIDKKARSKRSFVRAIVRSCQRPSVRLSVSAVRSFVRPFVHPFVFSFFPSVFPFFCQSDIVPSFNRWFVRS